MKELEALRQCQLETNKQMVALAQRLEDTTLAVTRLSNQVVELALKTPVDRRKTRASDIIEQMNAAALAEAARREAPTT